MDGSAFKSSHALLSAFVDSKFMLFVCGLMLVGVLAILAVVGWLAWWVISHLQWVS